MKKRGLLLMLVLTGVALSFPLWVRSYNGPANSDEDACAVLTDGERNVIVVGSSPGTGTAYDIVVIKYSPNGDSLWCRRIAGSGMSNDYARAAVIDGNGAIYITGTTGTFPDYNIITLKLNSDGSEAWRAIYQGSAGRADEPADMVIDGSGNVFITGYETDADGVANFVTVKYNSSGGQEWSANYDGGAADQAVGIALAPDGGVYVTGPSTQGSYPDFAIVKYTANGAEEWSQTVNGSGNADDTPVAIGVDASGAVYVTGKTATAPPPGGRYNYLTVKFSSAGSQLWSKVYTGANQGAQAVGLVVGTAGVYVTGKVTRGTNSDFGTVAYNLNTGDTLWSRFFNGPANKNDDPAFITLDAQGRVHIVGASQDTLSRYDYTWLRYSNSGTLQGSCFYNGALNNDDRAVGLAIDAVGQVILTGVSFRGIGSPNYDIVTVKYDSAAPGVAELRVLEPRRSGMQMQPNPAHSYTRTRLSGQGGTVRLWDIRGALCRQEKIAPGTTELRLDLQGIAPGVYLIEIRENGHQGVARLIVE